MKRSISSTICGINSPILTFSEYLPRLDIKLAERLAGICAHRSMLEKYSLW